jgi:hypothetical protein
MGKKSVDPKKLAGAKKLDLSTVPLSTLVLLANPMGNGAGKYGKYNWLEGDKKLDMMTYINANLRHMILFMAGQDVASDSGVHHLDHAMASLAVLRDAMLANKVNDNRITYDKETLNRLESLIDPQFKGNN